MENSNVIRIIGKGTLLRLLTHQRLQGFHKQGAKDGSSLSDNSVTSTAETVRVEDAALFTKAPLRGSQNARCTAGRTNAFSQNKSWIFDRVFMGDKGLSAVLRSDMERKV